MQLDFLGDSGEPAEDAKIERVVSLADDLPRFIDLRHQLRVHFKQSSTHGETSLRKSLDEKHTDRDLFVAAGERVAGVDEPIA